MNRSFVLVTIMLAISGCAINQQVEQANISNDAEICIIENSAVREGFLLELEKILREKNIQYLVTDAIYANKNCEWTVTYTARWSWDLTIYMSYAEINVFKNGVLDGKALYDSTRGGANMGKFIDAEPKIRELVDQLMQRESGGQVEVKQSQSKSDLVQQCIDNCVKTTDKSPEACFDICAN